MVENELRKIQQSIGLFGKSFTAIGLILTLFLTLLFADTENQSGIDLVLEIIIYLIIGFILFFIIVFVINILLLRADKENSDITKGKAKEIYMIVISIFKLSASKYSISCVAAGIIIFGLGTLFFGPDYIPYDWLLKIIDRVI